jgi:TonB family protein
MTKYLTIALLIILFTGKVKANTSDTTIFYFKNSGLHVTQKDSADFVRYILPPDTTLDRDLYRVYDYASDGKLRMTGTSLSRSINLVLEGRCFIYFPNGKTRATMDFSKGIPNGYFTQYFPNGKVYTIVKISVNLPYYETYNMYAGLSNILGLLTMNNVDLQVLECRDSTGAVTASKGNGHFVQYSYDFTKVIQQGEIVNNKQEGEWSGPVADTGKFVIMYHRGVIKSGISYMNSGTQYKFKAIATRPVYSDGAQEFSNFIKKNAVYLESARKRKIAGTVNVKFFVEADGTLSGVEAMQPGLTESLNQEAVRVVKMSPPWIAGTIYGVPTKMSVTTWVNFSPN